MSISVNDFTIAVEPVIKRILGDIGLSDHIMYQGISEETFYYKLFFGGSIDIKRFPDPKKDMDNFIESLKESLENSNYYKYLKEQHNKEIQELKDEIAKLQEQNHNLSEHLSNGAEFLESKEESND